MTTFVINDVSYSVTGRLGRERFIETLESCGLESGVKHFRAWRGYRQGVNVAAISGIFFWTVWVFVPVYAPLAGAQANKLEDQIRDTKPAP